MILWSADVLKKLSKVAESALLRTVEISDHLKLASNMKAKCNFSLQTHVIRNKFTVWKITELLNKVCIPYELAIKWKWETLLSIF
jgi:hypothetical protein